MLQRQWRTFKWKAVRRQRQHADYLNGVSRSGVGCRMPFLLWNGIHRNCLEGIYQKVRYSLQSIFMFISMFGLWHCKNMLLFIKCCQIYVQIKWLKGTSKPLMKMFDFLTSLAHNHNLPIKDTKQTVNHSMMMAKTSITGFLRRNIFLQIKIGKNTHY